MISPVARQWAVCGADRSAAFAIASGSMTLCIFRFERVLRVDDVDAARLQTRNDEVAPVAGLAVARRADVPAEVVEFVAGLGHREAVDDLRISLRRRVGIDDREVIGLVDAGVRVGAGDEEQLLARSFHRLLG